MDNVSLKTRLQKINETISSDQDLNMEKDNISALMKEVEFYLGNDDHLVNEIAEMLAAMYNFDFSKRIQIHHKDTPFLTQCLSSALNWINDEFQAKAMNVDIVFKVFETVNTNNDLMIMTEPGGNIKHFKQSGDKLDKIPHEMLEGVNIRALLRDFRIIDDKIASGEGTKDIEIPFHWKDRQYDAIVNPLIISKMAKLDPVIYFIRFK